MKELLVSKGFYKFRDCQCGGSYTEKFRNDDILGIVVVIKERKGMFVIKKHARQIATGMSDIFETELNKIL